MMTFGIQEYTDRIKPIAMSSYTRFSKGIDVCSRDILANNIKYNSIDMQSMQYHELTTHPSFIKPREAFINSIEKVTLRLNDFNRRNSRTSKKYRLIYTKFNTFLYIWKGDEHEK